VTGERHHTEESTQQEIEEEDWEDRKKLESLLLGKPHKMGKGGGRG